MKKLIGAILITFTAAALLAGCKAKGADDQERQSAIESSVQESGAGEAAGKESGERKDGEQETRAGESNGQGEESSRESQADDKEEGKEDITGSQSGVHHIEISIKDYGTVAVELDGVHAPITVDNFLNLAKAGFYDGLTFHRIISGFMIQGGDPLGTGMGGSEETIKGEFSSNGVDNPLSHTRGAISMARSQSVDSASSQFFIVHQDSQFLDGDYAAFGYVTEGMDVVDQICKDTHVEDNNGTVSKENQPVIESIRVLD